MNILLTKSLLLSFFIAVTTTPLVIKFFQKKGWVDDPKTHRHPKVVHRYPVPRGGGIPVFLAVSITALFFLPADHHLLAILVAALITTVVGVIDDIKEVSPYWRLLVNFFVAAIIIKGGVAINFITNPFDTVFSFEKFPLIKIIITSLWLVWCMNIIGWSGGVDGQLPGFVVISALVIGALGLKFSQDITQWPVVTLSGAIAGGYLGLLVFNAYPQKIIPGYSGKSLAGLMLGVLAILSGAKLATAILVLAVPMIDGGIVITRRLLNKKSPFWGDAQHLHHLLLKAGIPKPKIALFYWILSFLLGILVLNLNIQQKLYALAMAFLLIGGGIILLQYFINRSEKK